jgi:site-specific DNA recombinase
MSKNNKNSKHSLPSTNGLSRARRHRNGSDKLTGRPKACAYLRMAHDECGASSIEIQRAAVLEMAEREGYEIVQWYVDEGLTGSRKSTKRPQWCKLLVDAPVADWEVVLVYTLSRFSRLDSIEARSAKQILMEAGKKIHAVVEGVVDWDTATGRIIDTIRCEVAHDYSRKLGHATLRGKLHTFMHGKHIPKHCPYGYARRVTDPHGHQHDISRKEKFAVPKGWTTILVHGDPEEIEVARWVFHAFATHVWTIAGLARQLNDRAVPAPMGGRWLPSAIVRLLANDAYVGDTRFGRRSSGKFYRLVGDKVVKADHNALIKHQEGLVRRNTHAPIIDREMWDLVQAKLNRRSSKE